MRYNLFNETTLSCSLSESFKMSGALESYVNRPVSVITADGRNFVGTLKVLINFAFGKCQLFIYFRALTRPSTWSWMRLMSGYTVQPRGWNRSLALITVFFGVYLIWSFRLCLACTLSGVTTFAWWVLASYFFTRVLESGLICPILLMLHKAAVSPAGGWDWWRHWSASRPSQHQGLDHQIIKALQSWLHWLSWLWEKSRRYI